MDPEKIRENMRRLSYAGEQRKPRTSKPVQEGKPRWKSLPGDDLAEIQKRIDQEKFAEEIGRQSGKSSDDTQKPPEGKQVPRGGQYTDATTKEGRRYRRNF